MSTTLPGWSKSGIDNKSFIRMMGIRLEKGYELSAAEMKQLYHLARAYVVWKGSDGPVFTKPDVETIAKAIDKKYVADWQAKNPRAPIYLNFAMNIMFNPKLAMERLGRDHWFSPEGKKVRKWLTDTELVTQIPVRKYCGLVEYAYEITDRGRAWVEHSCGTPLPVAHTETVSTTTTRWMRG